MNNEEKILKILERMEGDIGELKSDVGGLKDDVGGLKSDVGGLKSDVAELKGSMKELERKVDALDRFAFKAETQRFPSIELKLEKLMEFAGHDEILGARIGKVEDKVGQHGIEILALQKKTANL